MSDAPEWCGKCDDCPRDPITFALTHSPECWRNKNKKESDDVTT